MVTGRRRVATTACQVPLASVYMQLPLANVYRNIADLLTDVFFCAATRFRLRPEISES